ncbi:MAG: hypothetical protein R2941_01125 [Desulfobacterales bacterium]
MKQLFRVCNPTCTLGYIQSEKIRNTIGFFLCAFRSLIQEIRRTIALSDEPSFQIFTGHASTANPRRLLRLKKDWRMTASMLIYAAYNQQSGNRQHQRSAAAAVRKLDKVCLNGNGSVPGHTGAEADRPESGPDRSMERINKEIFAIAKQMQRKGKAGPCARLRMGWSIVRNMKATC